MPDIQDSKYRSSKYSRQLSGLSLDNALSMPVKMKKSRRVYLRTTAQLQLLDPPFAWLAQKPSLFSIFDDSLLN